jgi:predicted ABC-type transport system involved in lysophospholipase L1 biosynthesis ATPase subunit
MSRDELRTRITGGVPLETKEQAHHKAEEIVKKHMNEKLGVEEQKEHYPRTLKQHPQQRIYIGDTII